MGTRLQSHRLLATFFSDVEIMTGWCAALLLLFTCGVSWGQSRNDMSLARQRMVREQIVASGISAPRVIRAMQETPRHEFVPRLHRKNAYYDMALPIGEGQTISSPFIVAFMTDSLEPQPSDKVLEIGTGSGYQAAVLSPLVAHVYTIEIVPSLARRAERTLNRLGYKNVHVRAADGYAGWPQQAPFDKIIVTCSPEDVPPALVEQLREGGRMIIPVGQRYQQTLYLFRKKEGKLQSEALRPTLFVPMTGRAESHRDVLPNPAVPTVINGGFEESRTDHGQVAGWYYQRQIEDIEDSTAPEGRRYARFANETPGRESHALQGLGVDGRKIAALRVSAWIQTRSVVPGPEPHMLPMIVITFYDQQRREVGHRWLGPWRDDQQWRQVSGLLPVSPTTREAILRVGLFGAVGELGVDAISVEVEPR